MSTAKTILGVVPTLMATKLVMNTMPRSNFGMKSKKRKRERQRIIPRGFLGLMIGVPIISATATEINKMD
jgi:hypothetical protein